MSLRDEIRKRLRDINMDFLQGLCVAAPWQYEALSKSIMSNENLTTYEKRELFVRHQASCMNQALARCARQHGIPHEVKKLPCNGQNKILVKSGRVVIIQETLQELEQHPKAADYKMQLASSMGVIRQLELDLGDQPGRILDWQDSTLAVLLHGFAGSADSANGFMLGSMFLAVPDVDYQNWVMRFDLFDAAYNGFNPRSNDAENTLTTSQPDNVRVYLRKQRKKEER
ncbi:hypothetical protein [Roseibium sp.]|uniref:hypothetical protein n=1 Tax=Roseibium sp. TaxID=1936156 RepID=UPI003512B1B7